MKFSDIKIGQRAELNCGITQGMVDHFIVMTGDVNSVHMGENAIVHGMLSASFISTFIGTVMPGDGAIWITNHLHFIKPVKVGDKLVVMGQVAGKNYNNNQIELYIDIMRGIDLVISATCSVKVPI